MRNSLRGRNQSSWPRDRATRVCAADNANAPMEVEAKLFSSSLTIGKRTLPNYFGYGIEQNKNFVQFGAGTKWYSPGNRVLKPILPRSRPVGRDRSICAAMFDFAMCCNAFVRLIDFRPHTPRFCITTDSMCQSLRHCAFGLTPARWRAALRRYCALRSAQDPAARWDDPCAALG